MTVANLVRQAQPNSTRGVDFSATTGKLIVQWIPFSPQSEPHELWMVQPQERMLYRDEGNAYILDWVGGLYDQDPIMLSDAVLEFEIRKADGSRLSTRVPPGDVTCLPDIWTEEQYAEGGKHQVLYWRSPTTAYGLPAAQGSWTPNINLIDWEAGLDPETGGPRYVYGAYYQPGLYVAVEASGDDELKAPEAVEAGPLRVVGRQERLLFGRKG